MTDKDKAEIVVNQLKELDLMCIRPIRAILCNKSTDYDYRKLKYIDDEAEKLRKELEKLYKE